MVWFSLLLLLAGNSWAQDEELRRTLVSTKIFGAFLAADEAIEEKTGPDGALHLVVVHRGDPQILRTVTARLAELDSVRGIKVVVTEMLLVKLSSYQGPPIAGIFVAERLPTLRPVIALSARYRALIFSPFAEDLSRGAHGGMYVSDRLLPEVSDSALRNAGIQLKQFFLGIAKHVR